MHAYVRTYTYTHTCTLADVSVCIQVHIHTRTHTFTVVKCCVWRYIVYRMYCTTVLDSEST